VTPLTAQDSVKATDTKIKVNYKYSFISYREVKAPSFGSKISFTSCSEICNYIQSISVTLSLLFSLYLKSMNCSYNKTNYKH
jgi:hypothetical protein